MLDAFCGSAMHLAVNVAKLALIIDEGSAVVDFLIVAEFSETEYAVQFQPGTGFADFTNSWAIDGFGDFA